MNVVTTNSNTLRDSSFFPESFYDSHEVNQVKQETEMNRNKLWTSRFNSKLATIVLFLLAFVATTVAQSPLGRISGTVKDTTGAVVAGATVTATDVQTSAV